MLINAAFLAAKTDDGRTPAGLLFCVFVGFGGFDAEFIYKAIELATFDAEDSGSGDSSAFGVFERLRNDPAFDFIKSRQLVFGIRRRIGYDDFKRHYGGLDFEAIGKDVSTLDSIGEFADVAGPGVAEQEAFDGFTECLGRLVIEGRLVFEEVPRQIKDVFFAMAKRRNLKANNIEAVIKV
jgi:hypothetical protein